MKQKEIVYGINYIPYNEPIMISSTEELYKRFSFVDDLIIYTPKARPLNIFFTSPVEAIKVSEYFNQTKNDAYYNFFVLPKEQYTKIKEEIEDKALEYNIPTKLFKQIEFYLFNNANEYFISTLSPKNIDDIEYVM